MELGVELELGKRVPNNTLNSQYNFGLHDKSSMVLSLSLMVMDFDNRKDSRN